jgi:hypothetical protein
MTMLKHTRSACMLLMLACMVVLFWAVTPKMSQANAANIKGFGLCNGWDCTPGGTSCTSANPCGVTVPVGQTVCSAWHVRDSSAYPPEGGWISAGMTLAPLLPVKVSTDPAQRLPAGRTRVQERKNANQTVGQVTLVGGRDSMT